MSSSTLSPTHVCPGCGATLGNNFTRCPACDAEQPPQQLVSTVVDAEVIPETQIKTLVDGREAYYPWGIFGRGYVLKDEASRDLVRLFQRRWRIAGFCIGLAFVAAIVLKALRGTEVFGFSSDDLWLIIAFAAAYLLNQWFGWFFRLKLVAKLERIDERLTLNELILKRASMTSPPSLLWDLFWSTLIPAIFAIMFWGLPPDVPQKITWIQMGLLVYFSLPMLGNLVRVAEYIYAMSLRVRAFERGA